MRRITVLVTGVGGGGHGEQILKALRLAATPYRIVGADMSPISKGLADVDVPYLLPPANHPEYLDALLALCAEERVEALFHGSEPELKVMSAARERIEAAGIFLPINPRHVIDTCMDKSMTMRFLSENGFPFPRSVTVRQPADTERIDFLPVVLKPSVGGGGSANVLLAQTKDELALFARYLSTIYPEFIAQEYVGTPECEYTAGVLVSMEGELLNSIAVNRMIMSSLANRIRVPNRTGRAELGPTLAISSGVSQGEIGPFPEVTRQCEEIALRLGARGAINLQLRLVGGKVHIFEINPRFSGTTSLRAMVGYNEPDVLVRAHVLGERCPPRFPYRSGVIMRGLAETYIAPGGAPPEARTLLGRA